MKILLKITRNKNKKHNNIKLNRIDCKISESLINRKISHEDFMKVINKERKYPELKESIRMINSQRSDAEKTNLIEEGKKKGIY